ncbi:MAG: phosphoadenylyl-sulfate reductase [Anaerolineae bacterium]|nr:phosphoadenylyl-sulfate reductase [Anaerolineae bacterium]
MARLNINLLNNQFENAPPADILRWARVTFGPKVVASSSFQTQSLPLLHLISQIYPEMPVIFLDTGFHFPETLAFRDELQAYLGLKIIIARPPVEKSHLIARYGEGLYRHDPDLCCYINKVEPMRRALIGFDAWISGVRRDQTAYRQELSVLETQRNGPLKIYPMLNWTREQIFEYIQQHQLPTHPLLAKGYRSIGCAPCTRPVLTGDDDRAGRWPGSDKTECGLHFKLTYAQEEAR